MNITEYKDCFKMSKRSVLTCRLIFILRQKELKAEEGK